MKSVRSLLVCVLTLGGAAACVAGEPAPTFPKKISLEFAHTQGEFTRAFLNKAFPQTAEYFKRGPRPIKLEFTGDFPLKTSIPMYYDLPHKLDDLYASRTCWR